MVTDTPTWPLHHVTGYHSNWKGSKEKVVQLPQYIIKHIVTNHKSLPWQPAAEGWAPQHTHGIGRPYCLLPPCIGCHAIIAASAL